jgi:hypothetical protein
MSASLSRKLTRLEATHKQILRCLWCRYALHEITPSSKRRFHARPGTLLSTKCWFCGTSYVVPLPRDDEHYRKAADLFYNSHPIKRYNDERMHAAELWLHLAFSHKEKYELAQREEAEKASQPVRQPAYQSAGKLSPKERREKDEREETKRRAHEFIDRKRERLKRRANGPESFPLDETIEALDAGKVSAYSEQMYREAEELGLEKHKAGFYHYQSKVVTVKSCILKLKKREACEGLIWGVALPDTLEEIAYFEALLPPIAAEALEKQRDEKEKKAREDEERKRQHEEYLARTRSRQTSTVQSVPAQPGNPALDDFLRRSMGEAAYNAMREAQGLSRDGQTTDAQGHGRVELPYIPQEQESKPPSDDGTLRYQQKLAHYRQTGVWLPDSW